MLHFPLHFSMDLKLLIVLCMNCITNKDNVMSFSVKRKAREQAREAKRARQAQSNTLESLPIDEQEQLALFLLRNKH